MTERNFSLRQRLTICFCGISGGIGVGMAALVTHLPKEMFIADGQAMARAAVEMQLWHSLAMLALGLARIPALRWPAAGFAVGQILFCVPVYDHALRGSFPVSLAPWGGTILILSWFALAGIAIWPTGSRRLSRPAGDGR